MTGKTNLIAEQCRKSGREYDSTAAACREYFQESKVGYHSSWAPGFNSYVETRLTAIAVSTPAAQDPGGTVIPTTKVVTTSGIARATAATTANTGTVANLLNSAQTFRVSVGAYLPWVPIHGSGINPHGLLVAPIAKAGFDTVLNGDSSQHVILPNGNQGALTYQTAYKFYSYGLRVGEVGNLGSRDHAPSLNSYFDATIGRFSNLQSFICHPPGPGGRIADASLFQASSCVTEYPEFTANNFLLSRKQLYRLSLEGLIEVPLTGKALPLYVGFNANIAQRTGQADRLDHGYATPDDIRIFFGTRLDINKLASAISGYNRQQ